MVCGCKRFGCEPDSCTLRGRRRCFEVYSPVSTALADGIHQIGREGRCVVSAVGHGICSEDLFYHRRTLECRRLVRR